MTFTYSHRKVRGLTAKGILVCEASCDDIETSEAVAAIYAARGLVVTIRDNETEALIERLAIAA
jgi:hypothetical protein